MFANKGLKQDVIIAGKSAGKKISITPQAEPVYKEIRSLAQQGNYWAQITVNALHQLASGRLHQDNIFIKPGPVHRGGEEEFVMILPGCKVTVEKQSKDAFKIVYFEADAGYSELQGKKTTPGIFTAKYAKSQWQAKKRTTGEVKPDEGRLVAICDSRYSDQNIAAETVAPSVASSHYSPEVGERDLRESGFELHLTPGVGRIGGLTKLKDAIKPCENQNIHTSAILLARSMYKARKIKNISWIAERGGSAVLTQAMKILADQGKKLPSHNIFLFEPKTSQVKAIEHARLLGMNMGRKVSRVSAFNFAGIAGSPSASINRMRNEKDFKLGQTLGDAAQLGVLLGTGAGIVTSVAGVTGINVGAIASSVGVAGAAAVPAIGAFLKALSAAKPYVKDTKALTDAAMAITENVAPRIHNKIKSKF
ncbi:hypothetical protein [Microbulbifer sp. MCCC 1A16149]|uniref:hypothetical protein n=1 Tax=Microbulbifer sp. MCCC 1A16149 TaxID=3411322 RepID=UPI003D0F79EE